MTRYIILRNSVEQAAFIANPAAFAGHKFVVIQDSYKPTLTKASSQQRAMDGTLDQTDGSVTFSGQYVLRVTETPSSENTADHYGSQDDLEDYFILNNPKGTPSNLITLVDHYGNTHNGFLIGDHSPQPLTTILEGEDAHFFVAIQFMERDPVA